MPAPSTATFSLDARVDAHEAFLALLDAGTGAALIYVYDSADVLLATVTLDDPAGAVSGTTGVLTFAFAAGPFEAVADGVIAYADFCDSDDTIHLSLPAQAGVAAVSGKIVFNSLNILTGAEITIVAATLG
jgi:hypothetical protein